MNVPIISCPITDSFTFPSQIEWLNTYHEQCRLVVGQVLEDQGKESALQWLMRETLPLG